MPASSDRIKWIDNLKAVGIILVVFAHNDINLTIRQYIYSFHMPLFFFLSGVLFNGEKYNPQEYIAHKLRTRIKPYFLLSVITYLFWIFVVMPLSVRGEVYHVDKLKAFIGIFYGIGTGAWRNQMAVALWFLPCLFCVELLFYFIAIKSNFLFKRVVIYTLCLVGFGCFLNVANVIPFRLPWSLDTAFIAVAFYAFGYLGISFWNKIQIAKHSLIKLIVSFVLLSVGVLLSRLNGIIDMASNSFHNPLLFIITPCFFIIPLIYFFRKISMPWLTFLGESTLLILTYHYIALFVIRAVIYVFTKNTQPFVNLTLIENSILVTMQLLLLYPVIKIHNKYFPWIMR